jgi:flagellar protein FlaG
VPATAKSARAAQGEAPVNQVIDKATRKFQDAWLPVNSHLHLEVNAMTRTVTVKVINDQSGEVIRQIPSEELMGLAVAMENGEGVLVNRRI